MKIKHLLIILNCIVFFIFFNTCGLEDSYIYYQEPRNLHVEKGLDAKYEIWFTGENQEQDDDDDSYLFVGYDVYYYFTSSSSAQKAAVRNPQRIGLPHTVPLYDFTDNDRFPPSNFSSSFMNTFYQFVTIPVTINMIRNVLKKGKNDNVRFTFQESNNDPNPGYIPYINSSPNYIFIDGIYPNYSEYKNQTWNDADFQGFYDKDYYDYKGINYESYNSITDEYTYKIYIYIIAKGFNSSHDRTQNMIESLKSNIIEINLVVNGNTKKT
jgi:hypothetical protein